MTASTVSVSVLVRTAGRPQLLAETLASLMRCTPRPGEVVVVDQSEDRETEAVVEGLHWSRARVLPSAGRGRGRAMNEGLQHASHATVFVVDDDCTVSPDWIAVGLEAMTDSPAGIICGRVLSSGGDGLNVPSLSLSEEPREFTGEVHYGVLYTGNMVCAKDHVLAVGGFDERVLPAAEDCEFCYRWLRAGGELRHVPGLVVWHRDWRTPDELSRLYVDYARGRGMFYAKYLRARDLRMLRFIAADYYAGLRSIAEGWFGHTPAWSDPRRGVFRGVPRGLWAGWRSFR